MITEDYCSFEVAKLLKEKGFDELCIFKYNNEDIRIKAGVAIDEWQNSELDDNECSAPTHQMAMKWLRVEKYVLIFIVPAKDEDGNLTYCADVWTWNEDEGIYEPTWAFANYIYEKSVEAAIKYSLENLI